MPSPGLTLTSADRANGLAGAYRRGDEVVFFRAHREGVNEEWVIEVVLDPLRRRSSTPKYSVRVQVLDRNCQNIASTGGFRDGSVAPYTASADDVEAHQADLRLVEEAMFAVAGSSLAAPLGPSSSNSDRPEARSARMAAPVRPVQSRPRAPGAR